MSSVRTERFEEIVRRFLEAAAVPELSEPAVALRPMAAGGEVVEDYGHVGLTLSATTGRHVARLLSGESDAALAPFSIARFQ